ncbi:class I SAM-dependent methyltransferase [Shewanella waksmanii]|uniref:class I SAM-dependent methyltransferase n=1 Tax=Shewanella waksmanii TaxID=213783 RepID=UPI003735B97A
MEQIQNYLVTTKSTSWLEQRYRGLVFSALGHISHGAIEINDKGQHYHFGSKDAQLTAQITILDASFYKDMVVNGSIGAAEAFIAGKWTSHNLTSLISVMARNQQQLDKLEQSTAWISKLKKQLLRLKNSNSQAGSKRNILAHYDIGNDLYERFLDDTMLYSCAVYPDKDASLAQAQQHKMRTICDKLALCEQDSVIEIGTGWGGLGIYMASHFGCHVTTTTISDAQYELAKQRISELGLEDKITLLKQDYRLLEGQYDKLVSIEMIEAVGHEYLGGFFNKCASLLKSDGKMLIQAITIADSRYETYRKGTDFIQKYIFPGGCLPSVAEMTRHIAGQTDLVVENLQDIGLHYARTLNDWRINFEASWEALSERGYSEEFKRLWLFYFAYCEGAFKQRVISTHHLVARKPHYLGQVDESVLDY